MDQYLLSKRPGTSLKTTSGPILTLKETSPGTSSKTMYAPILTLKETRDQFEDNVWTNTYSQRDEEPVRRQCMDQYLLSKRPGTSMKTMYGPILTLKGTRNKFEDNVGPILTLKETRNKFEDNVWTNTYSQRDQEPV